MDLRNPVGGIAERLLPEDLATTRPGAEHLARYLFAAHWATGRNIADLCCGVGYGTNLLHAAGAPRALGLDVSKDAIEAAEGRYGGCEFAVADVTQPLKLSDFTVRVCFEGLEHVKNSDGLLRNLAGAEVAIISTPNGNAGHSGNPHHVYEYSREEFRSLLERHFGTVRLFFQWRYPNPFAIRWGILRALVPVRLKSKLGRNRTARGSSEDTLPNGLAADSGSSEDTLPIGLAAEYRPLPEGYLSKLPPGFRYGEPSVWVAVCS